MQILLQQPLYTVQQSVDKKPKVTPSEAAREYRKLNGERPADSNNLFIEIIIS